MGRRGRGEGWQQYGGYWTRSIIMQVWTNSLCTALTEEEMAALDEVADGAGGAEDNASTAGAVGGVGTVDGIVFIEREAMLLYYGSTWIVRIVMS